MKSLTYVELDIPVCSLVYGTAPCTAAIPTTGAIKCFNTRATCQDRANYDEDEVTLRFAAQTEYLPSDIDCIPSILSVDFTPATVSLGENLGTRATLTVTFRDHPHSDTGEGYDKYLADRDYDPYKQGTYWGKFRARQPFLRGRSIRWITGLLGDDLASMEIRHFVIESFDGPSPDGKYTLVAKDILKLLDGDRSQAPAVNTGYLSLAVTDTATTATLAPSGVGDEEYDDEGYLALGGKEIVSFTRFVYDTGRNDEFVKILLECNGTNGSTTVPDTNGGGSAHTWTASSAALSTVAKKFGTASLLTSAGYISTPDHADFTLGSGDWTFELQLNCNGTSGFVYLCGQSATGAASDSSFLFQRSAGQKIQALVFKAGTTFTITGTTSVNDSTWRHIALVRTGDILRLFINGTQEGGDVAFTGSVNDSSGAFAIGRFGAAASSPSSCYFDAIRLSVGIARWTANFTAPTSEVSGGTQRNSTGDVIAITGRGQLGTTAQAFAAQDRVQTVLKYTSEDAADIIYDLMVNYAGVDPSFITLTDWQTETTTFNGRLYTATICEPTSAATLISEIIQQACLCVWWDDVAQKIRLQVLRGITTDAAAFTPENTIQGSLTVKEQPDKRVSQVLIFFGQVDPTKQLSNLDNFRSSSLTVDAEAEADYGGAVIKTILSRWIPPLGRTVADNLGAILLSRYRDPPRRLTFDLARYAETDVSLGGGYQVSAKSLQDETGAEILVPVQVTRLNAPADRFKVEAEEVLFTATDLTTRNIVIDTNAYNVNLRDAHDAIYPEAETGNHIVCRVMAGVIVGSTSILVPALDIGSWPSGVDVTLIVEGKIQGRGGDGGRGWIPPSSAPTSGTVGGPALYTRQAINLELPAAGKIWSGGGGGPGGGSGDGYGYGGFGGGGAGQDGGSSSVNPGTDTAGGLGGPGALSIYAWPGGPGGGPGLPSTRSGAGLVPTAAVSQPGASIDGVSYVTTTVSGGSVLGPQIN